MEKKVKSKEGPKWRRKIIQYFEAVDFGGTDEVCVSVGAKLGPLSKDFFVSFIFGNEKKKPEHMRKGDEYDSRVLRTKYKVMYVYVLKV